MKIPLKSAKVRVESDIFLGGSVLAGTVFSGFSEVRTHFELESDAPDEKLMLLVRNAKRGCFAENMAGSNIGSRNGDTKCQTNVPKTSDTNMATVHRTRAVPFRISNDAPTATTKMPR